MLSLSIDHHSIPVLRIIINEAFNTQSYYTIYTDACYAPIMRDLISKPAVVSDNRQPFFRHLILTQQRLNADHTLLVIQAHSHFYAWSLDKTAKVFPPLSLQQLLTRQMPKAITLQCNEVIKTTWLNYLTLQPNQSFWQLWQSLCFEKSWLFYLENSEHQQNLILQTNSSERFKKSIDTVENLKPTSILHIEKIHYLDCFQQKCNMLNVTTSNLNNFLGKYISINKVLYQAAGTTAYSHPTFMQTLKLMPITGSMIINKPTFFSKNLFTTGTIIDSPYLARYDFDNLKQKTQYLPRAPRLLSQCSPPEKPTQSASIHFPLENQVSCLITHPNTNEAHPIIFNALKDFKTPTYTLRHSEMSDITFSGSQEKSHLALTAKDLYLKFNSEHKHIDFYNPHGLVYFAAKKDLQINAAHYCRLDSLKASQYSIQNDLEWHGKHSLTVNSKNNSLWHSLNTLDIFCKKTLKIRSEKHFKISAKNNIHINSKENINLSTSHDMKIQAAQTITITSNTLDYHVNHHDSGLKFQNQQLQFKASTITIEASDALILKGAICIE